MFVVQKNHWNSFFKGAQYEIATAAGRQQVADMIDVERQAVMYYKQAALSPENLTCDGELSRSEVNRRYKELMTAAKQLKRLDPGVKFYEWEDAI